MKKLLGISMALLMSFALLSCVQEASIDSDILVKYQLEKGLGRFTAFGGYMPFQSGWQINAFTAEAMPKYLVIETKAGSNGLAEFKFAFRLGAEGADDGYKELDCSDNFPAGYGGAWASSPITFVIDITKNELYDDVSAYEGPQCIIPQWNNNTTKLSIAYLEAAYLVYDLEEETTLTKDDLAAADAVPNSRAGAVMWAFEGSIWP
jgi:hypothetical protein